MISCGCGWRTLQPGGAVVREIPGRSPVEMVAVSERAADDAPDTNYVTPGGRPVPAHNLIRFLSAPRFAPHPAPHWRVTYARNQRMHVLAVTFAVCGGHMLRGQHTVAGNGLCVSCCLTKTST